MKREWDKLGKIGTLEIGHLSARNQEPLWKEWELGAKGIGTEDWTLLLSKAPSPNCDTHLILYIDLHIPFQKLMDNFHISFFCCNDQGGLAILIKKELYVRKMNVNLENHWLKEKKVLRITPTSTYNCFGLLIFIV